MHQSLPAESESPSIGTLVATIDTFGYNPPGSRGIIYHTEVDNGVFFTSVILENGHDIGAFNTVEVTVSLQTIQQTNITYSYTTPAQLQKDFAANYFAPAFSLSI